MKAIKIDDKLVGDGCPCYVIAEAGVNHNGDIEMAKKLVDAAVFAQADAVKFQKRSIRDILIQDVLEQPYNSATALGSTYGEHRQKLELSEENFHELAEYCRDKGITFLTSAWDSKSADFINSLGVPAFKMASADLTNLPLLAHIARMGKPMIISTGMSTMEEVAEAVAEVRKHNEQIILLHCVSNYPCEASEVNLRTMHTLKNAFDLPVGYSGHEKSGWAVTLGAVAMGAVLVERHMTLDRTLPGPDHSASLEPLALSRLIVYIRSLEKAVGTSEKQISAAEAQVRKRLAKSIVASCDIDKGTTISPEMLTVKGPGDGLMPKYLPQLYGKTARCDVKADTLLPPEALDW